MLDHQISVASIAGRGSRFSVEVAAAPTRVDNDPSILDGMATLLAGWGCRTFKATALKSARQIVGEADTRLDGLLIDYHLDQGDGLDAIMALREQLGELPAILITADRSPRVRTLARAKQVDVLNKPLKPAALRALLTQWRVRRVAAECRMPAVAV